MPKRILVTGGAGFIGSHTVDLLVSQGHEVTVLDNLDPQVHGPGGTPPEYLNPGARFVRGDVRDRGAVAPLLRECDALLHLAAAVGVGQSMYRIAHYTSVNALGAATVLDVVAQERRSLPLGRMVVASSMALYGEGTCRSPSIGLFEPAPRERRQLAAGQFPIRCPDSGCPCEPAPTPESKRLAPTSVYAVGKRDHEELFLTVGRAYGISTVALRYFNVIGPRQSPSNPYTGVSAIFAARVLSGNPPVIYEDGLQTRDIIHVHDVARANALALTADDPGDEVFNVGTGRPVTIIEVARAVARAAGVSVEPRVTGAFREGDIRSCIADISRIRACLGFQPQHGFEDGVRDLMAWAGGLSLSDGFEDAARELREHGLVEDEPRGADASPRSGE